METTRYFKTEVLLSLTSGRLLCDFGDMHEAAEFIVGHPIWSHEFADKRLVQSIKDDIIRQHPFLDGFGTHGYTKDNWEKYRDNAIRQFGHMLVMKKGNGTRTESPVESLERIAPGEDIIELRIPDPNQN